MGTGQDDGIKRVIAALQDTQVSRFGLSHTSLQDETLYALKIVLLNKPISWLDLSHVNTGQGLVWIVQGLSKTGTRRLWYTSSKLIAHELDSSLKFWRESKEVTAREIK